MMSAIILRNHPQPFALFFQASVSTYLSYQVKVTAAAILSLLTVSLAIQVIDTSILCRLRL
jgi:hypothetical protein